MRFLWRMALLLLALVFFGFALRIVRLTSPRRFFGFDLKDGRFIRSSNRWSVVYMYHHKAVKKRIAMKKKLAEGS
jgi:hypothetical protein